MSTKTINKMAQGITKSTHNAHCLRQVKGMVKNAMKENNTPLPQDKPVAETTRKETLSETSMEEYLNKHYLLRFNQLTEMTEYRKRDTADDAYKVLDPRESNTLYIQLQKDGIKCTEHELLRYLHSTYVTPYHPFQLYLQQLPTWDHQDRVTELAQRVSSDPFWAHHFHRWMLALTAQWMGIDPQHANSTAPLLISPQQGWMKSTFCQSLMPPQLSTYYTDQMDITRNYQEKKLAVMGLINLDEFDRLSPRHMAQLKNLMQLTALNMKKAYRQNFQQLPRIASFIGTSNRKDLLTDPTGSRRFICVEVEKPIDCTHIQHDQLYAQLLSELCTGTRYWFTHEEETHIQKHNEAFYQSTPEDELFRTHFRAPAPDEESELLSLDQILTILQESHKGIMRNLNLSRFGNAIVSTGIERIHTHTGNRYRLVRI